MLLQLVHMFDIFKVPIKIVGGFHSTNYIRFNLEFNLMHAEISNRFIVNETIYNLQ